MYLVKLIWGTWFVHCIEVVHILEGPLLEVSEYFNYANCSCLDYIIANSNLCFNGYKDDLSKLL